MARGVTCTDPDSFLDTFPCLKCATVQELMVVLLGMFMVANATQDDIPTAEQHAAPLKSLSDREFLQALITALPDAWFENLTEENLTHDFGCLKCYPTQELKAMFLYQWCTFWTNYQA